MATALVASRLVQFAAAMLLLGASLFPLYSRGAFSGVDEADQTFDCWLRRTLLIAALLSLLSSLAWLSVQGALMGEGWADAVSGSTLSLVLLQTWFGRVWIVHLTLAGLVLVALLALYRAANIAAMIVIAVLSMLLVASLAWVGHSMSGTDRSIDVAAQMIHLLAASIWLGGLVPLGYVLWKAYRDHSGAWCAAARFVLPRYSQAGVVAVSLILFTGTFISWSLLERVSDLGDTTYGRVLLTKIVLVFLMIAIALINRLDLLPKLIHTKPDSSTEMSLFRLSRNVVAEQVLGIAVLAIVSVLGTLPPGDHSDHDSAGLATITASVTQGVGSSSIGGAAQ